MACRTMVLHRAIGLAATVHGRSVGSIARNQRDYAGTKERTRQDGHHNNTS